MMKKTTVWLILPALIANSAWPAAAAQRETADLSAAPTIPVVANITAASPLAGMNVVLPQSAVALPGAAQISAPASAARPVSAAAALETMSVRLTPKSGPSRQEETLDRAFDASSRTWQPQDDVLAGQPGRDEPSGLMPHRPQARRVLQKAVDKARALPRQITIGAGIAVLSVSLIAGLHHHAAQKNKHWQQSKSATESQLVDSARKTMDEQTAEAIKEKAKARHDRMAKRIADAKNSKSKKVDDATHDKLAQAKAYAAYDKLVSARAELALNEISKNPKKRVGEELPKTWQDELQGDESAAIAQNFDGFVALRLDQMNAELSREKSADERLSRDVEEFHDQVPLVFGGKMESEYDKAAAELKRFEQDELGAERKMSDGKTAAMRGRVGERLYAQDAQFHSRRDRRDRLSALYDKKAGPAAETARKVDSDLDDMISERHTESAMLALAAMHTNDTETYQDCDGNNNCTTKTRTVDNSGPYRLAAAAAAAAAQSDAEHARDGLQKLRPMIASLHNDSTAQDENLVSSLPSGANTSIDEGQGPITDWFLPPLFGLVGGMSSASDGERARDAFKPVLDSLSSVARQVSSRRDGEAQWVEQEITSEVQSEEVQAKSHSW